MSHRLVAGEPFTHGDGSDSTCGEGAAYVFDGNGNPVSAPRGFGQENDPGIVPEDEGNVAAARRSSLRSHDTSNRLTSSRGSLQGSAFPAPSNNSSSSSSKKSRRTPGSNNLEGNGNEAALERIALESLQENQLQENQKKRKRGSKGTEADSRPDSWVVTYYLDRLSETGGDMTRGTENNPFVWTLPDGLGVHAGIWLKNQGFHVQDLPPLGNLEEEMMR